MFTEISSMNKIKEIDRKLIIKTKDGAYSNNHKSRVLLTAYWETTSRKSAIAIGINPSKANDQRSDKTITTLSRFLDAYDYREIHMMNIFESYSTDQSGIDPATKTDFHKHTHLFEEADGIFVVWGLEDNYIDEKQDILRFLKKYEHKLFCLKNRNQRFPIHPSRMRYEDSVVQCFIESDLL